MEAFKPDYSKYTLDELEDALRSIDRDRFPERVETISAEISSRTTLNEQRTRDVKPISSNPPRVNILTKTDGKILHFIIRVWCIVLFYFPATDLHQIYTEGTTYARRSGLITFDGEPVLFSLEVAKSVFLAAILIFGFVKNPSDFKK